MAFTATIRSTSVEGNKRVLFGDYTNTGGSTGGDIRTGMSTVEIFELNPKGSAVIATESVINETFPLSNRFGDVTIVTSADESGTWEAKGL